VRCGDSHNCGDSAAEHLPRCGGSGSECGGGKSGHGGGGFECSGGGSEHGGGGGARCG
jgi:hypothetical protein